MMKILLNTNNNKKKMVLFILITGLGIILTIIGLMYGLKIIDPKYYVAIVCVILATVGLFSFLGKLAQDIKSANTQAEIKANTQKIIGTTGTIEQKIDTTKIDLLKEVDKSIVYQGEHKADLKKIIIEQSDKLISQKNVNPELYLDYSDGIYISKSDDKVSEFTFRLTASKATASDIDLKLCSIVLINNELKCIGNTYLPLINNDDIPYNEKNQTNNFIEKDLGLKYSRETMKKFTGFYFHIIGSYKNSLGDKLYKFNKLYFYNLSDASHGGVNAAETEKIMSFIQKNVK